MFVQVEPLQVGAQIERWVNTKREYGEENPSSCRGGIKGREKITNTIEIKEFKLHMSVSTLQIF